MHAGNKNAWNNGQKSREKKIDGWRERVAVADGNTEGGGDEGKRSRTMHDEESPLYSLAHMRRTAPAKQGPETTLRELHPRNRGDMEPRNAMWPSVTLAACDVRARPTDRPAAWPAGPSGSLSRLCSHRVHIYVHTRTQVKPWWFSSREPGNTVPWMHCRPIMDPMMLAFA